MDTHSLLAEWTLEFVKNKDITSRRIKAIEHNKNGFDMCVRYNDKEQCFAIAHSLENTRQVMQRIGHESCVAIVTLNSGKNLDFLFRNWNDFARFKFLSIIFVNPLSSLDKKWIIVPYLHDRICDKSSLELGLKSIAQAVEQIEEQELVARIRG